jgi:hypothetical protein
MKVWEVSQAGRFMGWLLRRSGFAGITTPWRKVYILPEYSRDVDLLAHELAHVRQIERDGAWKFWPRCLFYFLWYGHANSPIEIEARAMAAQGDAYERD